MTKHHEDKTRRSGKPQARRSLSTSKPGAYAAKLGIRVDTSLRNRNGSVANDNSHALTKRNAKRSQISVLRMTQLAELARLVRNSILKFQADRIASAGVDPTKIRDAYDYNVEAIAVVLRRQEQIDSGIDLTDAEVNELAIIAFERDTLLLEDESSGAVICVDHSGTSLRMRRVIALRRALLNEPSLSKTAA